MLGVAVIAALAFGDERTPPATRPVEAAIEADPAGHGCLDATKLAENVVAWLGPHELDARIHIIVRADADRRDRVHVQLWRADELLVERQFEPVPEDCTRTHAAVGLAIAIAIDSTILEPFGAEPRSAEPPPEPQDAEPEPQDAEADAPPSVEAPAPEPVATPPEPAPVPTRGTRAGMRRMAARVQGTVAAGMHPTIGFGGRARTELHLHRHFALAFGALATRGLATTVGDGDATVSLVIGDLVGCAGGVARNVRLHGCGGLAGGATLSTGSDFASTTRSVAPWLAALAGFSLTYPDRGIVALGVDLELAVPILKPRLVVTDVQTGDVGASRDFPPVGGLVSVGPVIQLP